MSQEPLSREAMILLWCIGRFQELKDAGLVTGGLNLTAKGIGSFDQLAADFRPTEEEIRSAVAFLTRK